MTKPPQTVALPLKVLVVAATVDDRRRLLYAMDTVRGVEVVGGGHNAASAAASIASNAPHVVLATHDVIFPEELRSVQTGMPIPLVMVVPDDQQTPARTIRSAPVVVIPAHESLSDAQLGERFLHAVEEMRKQGPSGAPVDGFK